MSVTDKWLVRLSCVAARNSLKHLTTTATTNKHRHGSSGWINTRTKTKERLNLETDDTRLQCCMLHLVHRGKVAPRKAGWKSEALPVWPKGLCRFRLTLGFVRKSAVSGNSTGSRAARDDEEPELRAWGPWLGEVTGLRLGEAPSEDKEHREEKTSGLIYCSS